MLSWPNIKRMIIDIKEVLTLSDNNKYVVVSKVSYEDNEELVEVEDKELNTKLLPMFLEAAKENIN